MLAIEDVVAAVSNVTILLTATATDFVIIDPVVAVGTAVVVRAGSVILVAMEE